VTKSAALTPLAPATVVRSAPVLQRKCACGTHTGGATCDSCQKGDDDLQRKASGPAPRTLPRLVDETLRREGSPLDASTRAFMEPRLGADFSRVRVHTDARAAASAVAVNAHAYTVGTDVVFAPGTYDPRSDRGRRLLAHELAHVAQQAAPTHQANLSSGAETDALEAQADAAAEHAVGTQPLVPAPLLRDDDVQDLSPGQLRKSEFLARVREAVRAAADAELAHVGRDTRGCPYLERWFGHYEGQPAARVERAARLFASGSRGTATAEALIPAVTARVAQAVSRWAVTGELPAMPDGDALGELTPDGLFAGLPAGSAVRSGLSRLFRKPRPSADAPVEASPALLPLEGGEPLDAATRDRMGNALDRDLSQVRVHTEPEAASLSSRLGARAFALGAHVAFAQGEYRPGTVVGDALLAHELAHVAQQRAALESPVPNQLPTEPEGGGRDAALEADADQAALDAVVSLWGRTRRGLRRLRRKAGPRLKSGLRLQSCGFERQPVTPADVPRSLADQVAGECTEAERGELSMIGPDKFKTCCTGPMLAEIGTLHGQAIPRVGNALKALDKPEEPEEQLVENFGIKPNDQPRIQTIRSWYQRIHTAMANGEGVFICRNNTDPFCKKDFSNGDVDGNKWITVCGDYEGSVKGGTYLSPADIWIKRLIHEYAHIVAGRGMLTAGVEAYRGRGERPYPPKDLDEAVRNPDSYAWFAMDVSEKPPAKLERRGLPPPNVKPSCPPALENPTWQVQQTPLLVPSTSCDLQLGQTGAGAQVQHGIDLRGNLKIAAGCAGKVYFAQFVKPDRRWVECDEAKERGTCVSLDWGYDSDWPYRYGTNAVLGGEQQDLAVSMFDSPGIQNFGGDSWPRSRVCVNDEFVTYLVYEDPSKKLTPLGWVHWFFTGTAERDKGRCPLTHTAADCSGWTVAGNGRKAGESFKAGAAGPRPLDANAQKVDKLAMAQAAKDCPPSSCTAGAAPAAPAPKKGK